MDDERPGSGYPISDGNEFAPVRRLHNVVFSPDYANDDTIFSATWNRILRSTDRGRSWVQIEKPPRPRHPSSCGSSYAPSPDYANDTTIYVGSRQGDIYPSTERGDPGTWKKISSVPAVDASAVEDRSFISDPILGVRSIVLSPEFATDPSCT